MTGKGQAIDIHLIGSEIMTTQKLGHCWSEFAATLHPQTAPDDMGQERVVRWRSTVPAEVFFNVETLIAVELRTEYFKHQPGILTGIGILGTFLGLLRRLSTFSVSSDPEKVRISLDTLILGVREAFYMSAVAIGFAMLTTLAEKLIVTGRIKQLEDLCQLLDSLFEGGAGEEYLARLVNASESSATQTAQLKDALVSDLKEMLAEMTRQQTEAIAASFTENSKAQIVTTEQSGDRIAQAISDSLSDPLQRIAAAVNTTTDTNGQVVTRALNEALVTFSQKMEDMFGGQIGDINQLLQQTTAAMQSTVARFDQLANNLGDAGKNAADVMSERLSIALESMEARQHTLNNTMTEFVSQLRDTVQSSQSETNSQLQKTLVLIGDQVSAMTDQLQNQAQAAADTHQNQQTHLQQNASALAQELATQVQTSMSLMQQQLASMIDVMKEQSAQTTAANTEQQKNLTQHTQNTVGAISDRVESTLASLDQNLTGMIELMSKQAEHTAQSHQTTQQHLAEQANRLVEQLSQQVQAMTAQTNNAVSVMQASVTSMRDVTKDNTQRMENSVGTLSLAADNFSKAGNSVVGVIQQTGTVTDKMATTSAALNVAATTVQTALNDYSSAGKAMSQMVEELKATVEVAKKDATVSQSLVNQIKQSAEHLLQAQSSVDGIFKEVCDELANAHDVFANNVAKGLKSSNTAYQKELKDAVDYLKTAIEELGEVAEKIPVRR
ncbi:MAG: anti-phage ZorAB system protein ZorA [Methylobacter sp.]